MSMLTKRWVLRPPVEQSIIRQYRDVHPIIAQILYHRGVRTAAEAHHFLYDKELVLNPFAMKDMQKAVDRIRHAIKHDELIYVYGDFDADGVTSTTLMMELLNKLRANARAYIPHRVDEGYGLNTPALQDIASKGATLVITVDCGIRSVQEIDEAQAQGLDVIITDHHSVGPEIPDACAVINPQQADCNGDPTLAGVGVALMLARGLLLDAWKRNGRQKAHLDVYSGIIADLMDLVAIGTVADVMPLNSPTNRALVRQGLDVINRARRPGVRALMDVAGVKAGQATAMSIGFGFGPRINAAGRLASAITAYHLLAAEDDVSARKYADKLQKLNQKRQQLTREAEARVHHHLEADQVNDADLIFAVDEEVVPGIVGLVAGRLTEAYYRPAVVVEMGADACHASCRSIPQFHITQALDECADLLVRHGGHAMAAGLTVLPENLHALQSYLQSKARAVLDGQDLTPTLDIDMELSFRHVDMALAQELSVLEPTGHENQPPLFLTRNMQIIDARGVGKNDAHLKLKLSADGQPPVDAIGFRLGAWLQDMPDCIDVAYHLEVNEWQGRRNPQLNIRDIRPAEDT